MVQSKTPFVTANSGRVPRHEFCPGDFGIIRGEAYSTLFEIIRVETDDLVRIRGVAWPLGYSVLVSAARLQPVNRLRPNVHTQP